LEIGAHVRYHGNDKNEAGGHPKWPVGVRIRPEELCITGSGREGGWDGATTLTLLQRGRGCPRPNEKKGGRVWKARRATSSSHLDERRFFLEREEGVLDAIHDMLSVHIEVRLVIPDRQAATEASYDRCQGKKTMTRKRNRGCGGV
jgi:hypothetical protein